MSLILRIGKWTITYERGWDFIERTNYGLGIVIGWGQIHLESKP